jgi:hypothetical protein
MERGMQMQTTTNILLKTLTEKSFQDTVIEAATLYGWMVHAERPAMTQNGWRTPIQGLAGFPDLVLCHPEKQVIIFAELKSESGKVSEAQQDWIIALGQCSGVKVFLWRPSDWNQIEKVLEG